MNSPAGKNRVRPTHCALRELPLAESRVRRANESDDEIARALGMTPCLSPLSTGCARWTDWRLRADDRLTAHVWMQHGGTSNRAVRPLVLLHDGDHRPAAARVPSPLSVWTNRCVHPRPGGSGCPCAAPENRSKFAQEDDFQPFLRPGAQVSRSTLLAAVNPGRRCKFAANGRGVPAPRSTSAASSMSASCSALELSG